MKKREDESGIFGKDEMNLVEFPITLLSKRQNPELKTLEFSDTIYSTEKKLIERKWIITGSDKFGLPLAQDNDVLIAILKIGKESAFDSKTIYFSRYRLLKVMGLSNQGKNYKRIEDALKRFSGLTIYAENAFYDNDAKAYISLSFGVIDGYKLFDSSSKDPKSHNNSVELNKYLYKSIKSGYIKNLDINLYFSLNSSISKQLYRYLDKKRYRKNKFEINLHNLAYSHIGFDPDTYNYASNIKQKLDPAHEELIKAGFLESATYAPTANRLSEKVIYIFADKKEIIKKSEDPGRFTDGNTQDGLPVDNEENNVLKTLVETGITETVALEIAKKYSAEKIKAQIEVLPFRNAKNPAALLIKAIQEDWAPPPEYKNHIDSKKRAVNNKAKKEKEEREKKEHRKRIEDYLEGLSREDMKSLEKEALNKAMEMAGNVFRVTGMEPHVLKSYIFMLVEERLKQKN